MSGCRGIVRTLLSGEPASVRGGRRELSGGPVACPRLSVRTEPVNHRSARRRRRLLIALVASIATVTGPLVVAGAPAEAVPIDTGWAVESVTGVVPARPTGPHVGRVVHLQPPTPAGSAAHARGTSPRSPPTRPAVANPIKVPWTWQGLHAWFGVTRALQPIVNDVPVSRPRRARATASPTWSTPAPRTAAPRRPTASSTAASRRSTNLQVGRPYGFRLVGRNSDTNNFLARHVHAEHPPLPGRDHRPDDNRQWPGATAPHRPRRSQDRLLDSRRGPLVQVPGRPGSEGHRRPQPALSQGLRPGALRRHRRGVRPAEPRPATSTELAASPAARRRAGTQVPVIPRRTSDRSPPRRPRCPSATFAPRVYAPRVYAPRVYAPRVYAPRVYAPAGLRAAGLRARLLHARPRRQRGVPRRVLRRPGPDAARRVRPTPAHADETSSAPTGNTDGDFYVRVQGHDDKDFDASTAPSTSASPQRRARRAQGSSTSTAAYRAERTSAIKTADRHRHQRARARRPTTRAPRRYMDSLDALAAATGRRRRRRRTTPTGSRPCSSRSSTTPLPLRRRTSWPTPSRTSSTAYRSAAPQVRRHRRR